MEGDPVQSTAADHRTSAAEFTLEELLREISGGDGDGQGQTTWELSRKLKCSQAWVTSKIRLLIADGKAEMAGYRQGVDSGGRRHFSPTYRAKVTPG